MSAVGLGELMWWYDEIMCWRTSLVREASRACRSWSSDEGRRVKREPSDFWGGIGACPGFENLVRITARKAV